MGKGSKLRQPEPKEYIPNGNGRRKEWKSGREFFEADAPPAEANTDIWHLALYFRDKAQEFDVELSGKVPILYTLLQKALTKLTPYDILARARTTGIDVSKGNSTWVSIVMVAIDEYLDYNYETTIDINYFCGVVKFEYYVQRAIETIAREKLIEKGSFVAQASLPVQQSKRNEHQQRIHEIRSTQYTEEELAQRMKDFRSRN